jgi:hypothetical protein
MLLGKPSEVNIYKAEKVGCLYIARYNEKLEHSDGIVLSKGFAALDKCISTRNKAIHALVISFLTSEEIHGALQTPCHLCTQTRAHVNHSHFYLLGISKPPIYDQCLPNLDAARWTAGLLNDG